MGFFNSLIHALSMLVLGALMWLSVGLSILSTTVVAVKNNPPILIQKIASSSLGIIPPAPNASSTTTPAAPPKKKVPAPLPQTPTPAAPATAVTITDDMIAQSNTAARLSLVNILCSFHTANTSSYISGSGLIIDPRGVVLTNAHVAQFFLLQNQPGPDAASCVVRTGSPATNAYTASLLYLPPAWIAANASQIRAAEATGTGELDYAFLYITGAAQVAPPLPSSFPSLSISTESPNQSDPVLLAAYPAGFLDASGVQGSLYISSAVSAIQQLYTFDNPKEVDLVSLGGTVVSQSGSSGGAVITLANNKLVGLISTESQGTTTASRDLRAITLSYINANLNADGKGSIAALLTNNLLNTSQDFTTNVAPGLAKELTAAINK